ncbi:fumarylacetoacetate hydrolase family protein [Chryseomicrobium sp. FSL W7-1435]|uniref:fumarylacetoacetate hydrolase family protein n=1 Tax=Chryseomicrobium sp. FSL W7-1435 TaxID=2921704 RepID=UPI00315AB15C
MKLLSYRHQQLERFGPKVKKQEAVWDVQKINEELQTFVDFPATLAEGTAKGMDFVEQLRKLVIEAENHPEAETFKHQFTDIEWLAPIPRTPKNIFAIGKNYADHAKEMGGEAVDFVVFTKSPTAIVGDEATVSVHSELTQQLDYEGELAIVIGKGGKNIPERMALDAVFGYTIGNDITARDMQKNHQQFFLGKSLAGSSPLGPYVVTKDELANPHELTIVTKVNDEIRQNGKTSDMVYSIEQIIAKVSAVVELEPGDIILTGTPAGVGKGFEPPKFLTSGDTVKVSIEGIGTLVTHIE